MMRYMVRVIRKIVEEIPVNAGTPEEAIELAKESEDLDWFTVEDTVESCEIISEEEIEEQAAKD